MKKEVKKLNSEIKKTVQHWWRTLSFCRKAGKLKDRGNPNRIILIGTPEHGNLGDHAIAKSEIIFLQDHFPDASVIEITGNYFRKYKQEIPRYIRENDKIIITGGGFMGSLWPLEETMVRDIIQLFSNNKIVIFPQTIYFDDTVEGNKMYQESMKIYCGHKNLKVCLREIKSYDLMTKKIFCGNDAHCLLVPDIVTYLSEAAPSQERNGILLCLRKDKEKNMSQSESIRIEQYALQHTDDIKYIDTVLPQPVMASMRDEELKKKIKEFKRAKLVITDRLHGMIFAAITGTPCIALNNSSGKVGGVYQWLKHLEYIQFIDSIEDISKYINELINMENCAYDNRYLKKYFQKLADIILEN